MSTRQNVPSNFGTGGTGITPEGSSVPNPTPTAFGQATPPPNPDLVSTLWALLARGPLAFATTAALEAFGAGPLPSNPLDRADGMFALVQLDNSVWTWNAASTAAAGATVLLANDAPATGRWLLTGSGTGSGVGAFDLKLAISHSTVDGAVLYTVPAGVKLRVARAYWEVTTPFTGGALSAIGVDSSNAAYNTAGDILGGSGGDVAAALTPAGYLGGTLGTKFGSNGVVVLQAGDTLKFNRVVSNFTAGAGFVHVSVEPTL